MVALGRARHTVIRSLLYQYLKMYFKLYVVAQCECVWVFMFIPLFIGIVKLIKLGTCLHTKLSPQQLLSYFSLWGTIEKLNEYKNGGKK